MGSLRDVLLNCFHFTLTVVNAVIDLIVRDPKNPNPDTLNLAEVWSWLAQVARNDAKLTEADEDWDELN